MPPKEFYFALTVPAPVSPVLLRDLVSRICAGCCAPDGVAELTRQVEDAVGRSAGPGDCEVRFQARHGALDVAVRAGAGQVWHITRPID